MGKKLCSVSFRMDYETYEIYKAKAAGEQTSMAGLITKATDEYINKDVNLQNSLLVATSSIATEVAKMKKEQSVLEQMMESVMHSLLCAFPERFNNEFMKREGNKFKEGTAEWKDFNEKAGMAEHSRHAADLLMGSWRKQLLQNRLISRAKVLEQIDKINASDEEEQQGE